MEKTILKILRKELEGILPDNKIRQMADDIFEITKDMVTGFKETIKTEIKNSEENQEQEQNEDYYQGQLDASKYAIEMIDKHLNLKHE